MTTYKINTTFLSLSFKLKYKLGPKNSEALVRQRGPRRRVAGWQWVVRRLAVNCADPSRPRYFVSSQSANITCCQLNYLLQVVSDQISAQKSCKTNTLKLK
ncbi:unnamed protein product [Spodoptera littoralis]|uniref:Uncharacterized protein n=1 Tax=Spodoptera littoralis TaxID=7109 RepID=A0A9P0IF57_SPOLI|nr:unnamed protein product [Spodoptera littoralis]CAH1646048.1 unnamed protein product [Spodoptera littoralis]